MQWRAIWERKGEVQAAELHHIDGFDQLTARQYQEMVEKVAAPLGLEAGDAVLECGCGAGAFLNALQHIAPGIVVTGVDYSPTLVTRAASRLEGTFHVGDLRDLSFLPAEGFDYVVSFSTFHYLDSLNSATRATREMARLVKPGGTLLIGEVNDLARHDEALAIRQVANQHRQHVAAVTPDHLFVPKALFEQAAADLGLTLTMVDHRDLGMSTGIYKGDQYRFSAYFRKGGPAAAAVTRP